MGKRRQAPSFALQDWMPLTWHLKGVSITLVSLYLEGTNCFTGNNAAKLASLGASPDAVTGLTVAQIGEFIYRRLLDNGCFADHPVQEAPPADVD